MRPNSRLTAYSSVIDPADLDLASEPPTPPTKTSERLRKDLQAVNEQLAAMKRQWDEERRKLLGENASLKDATSRLNAEVRQAKNDIKQYASGERSKVGLQGVSTMCMCDLDGSSRAT